MFAFSCTGVVLVELWASCVWFPSLQMGAEADKIPVSSAGSFVLYTNCSPQPRSFIGQRCIKTISIISAHGLCWPCFVGTLPTCVDTRQLFFNFCVHESREKDVLKSVCLPLSIFAASKWICLIWTLVSLLCTCSSICFILPFRLHFQRDCSLVTADENPTFLDFPAS